MGDTAQTPCPARPPTDDEHIRRKATDSQKSADQPELNESQPFRMAGTDNRQEQIRHQSQHRKLRDSQHAILPVPQKYGDYSRGETGPQSAEAFVSEA